MNKCNDKEKEELNRLIAVIKKNIAEGPDSLPILCAGLLSLHARTVGFFSHMIKEEEELMRFYESLGIDGRSLHAFVGQILAEFMGIEPPWEKREEGKNG